MAKGIGSLISKQELFMLAINSNISYPQIDDLLRAFDGNEQKIGVLEKTLADKEIGVNVRKSIYILLGKYRDIYGWEQSLSSTGKSIKERLTIKAKYYSLALDAYIKAGYVNGTKGEMKRLARFYNKLSHVYQDLGNANKSDEHSKKAEELLIKCGRKRLKPTTQQAGQTT